MAPRRNPKSGSPGPGARRETKHGGSKNGKKEGLSGSSFFTWFMVIALLGVWTSVAVVWFELVDYEEVLGKLGIYDADGDGDFDVDDAKILLGLKERSISEHPTQPPPKDAEEEIQAEEQPHAEPEHVYAEPEPEDEIESLLREVLESQLADETGEDNINEETPFLDEEENNEISDDTVEAPTLERDYDEELDYTIPEIVETPEMPESFQEEEPASDHQPEEPEQDETPDMKEDTHEPDTYEPEGTDYRELTLEDALEHNTEPLPEGTEPHDYVEEHNLENEVLIETQGMDGEPLTEHYHGNTQDEAVASDMVNEHTESEDEKEQANIHMTDPPRERDIPVQAEDYSNDNLVDT